MIEEQRDRITGFESAIDCGAGIGRILKEVLKPYFENVDLLEPSKVQIDEARNFVPETREFYHCGLQEFDFQTQYDCVWIQWCLCYLTDTDLMEFLIKTRETGLKVGENGKSGLVFVKENVAGKQFIVDKDDNSIMRTEKQFSAIF